MRTPHARHGTAAAPRHHAHVNTADDVVEYGLVVRIGVEGWLGEGHEARQHFGVVLEEADPPGHLLQHQLRRAARPRIEETGVDERAVLVRVRARARVRVRVVRVFVRVRVRVRVFVRVRVRVRV